MTNRKVAVVTGASSGIGRASARALAAKGYEVVCAARRLDRIEELAREIDGRAVQCDVTNREDVERLAAEAGPRVDVLVANAGGAFGTDPVASADLDDWRRMYEINVLGTLSTIQTTLPALEAAHGVIITIGSTAGIVSYEGGAGYCGSKHAVRALMGALRLELFDKPVRVCEIDPGMANTEFSTFASRTSVPSAPGAAIVNSRPFVVPQSSSRMMTSCETSTSRRVR